MLAAGFDYYAQHRISALCQSKGDQAMTIRGSCHCRRHAIRSERGARAWSVDALHCCSRSCSEARRAVGLYDTPCASFAADVTAARRKSRPLPMAAEPYRASTPLPLAPTAVAGHLFRGSPDWSTGKRRGRARVFVLRHRHPGTFAPVYYRRRPGIHVPGQRLCGSCDRAALPRNDGSSISGRAENSNR